MARNDYFPGMESKKEPLHSPFPCLSFFNFSVYYHAKPHTITETHIQTRKLHAVSVFVLYPPFFSNIFRQTNTPFSQNRQYPTPFYLSTLYYHGNPRLLRESILLPDSTIFSPIAILSAASKKNEKGGPPPTVMNPTKPQNPLILSHSSILSPASTQLRHAPSIPQTVFDNSLHVGHGLRPMSPVRNILL